MRLKKNIINTNKYLVVPDSRVKQWPEPDLTGFLKSNFDVPLMDIKMFVIVPTKKDFPWFTGFPLLSIYLQSNFLN